LNCRPGDILKAMITSGLVNVFTADMELALSFYRGVLELPETFRTSREGLPEHVELKAGGFVLGLSTAEAARRVHGLEAEVGRPAMSLVFWVDDIDATFAAATAAGAPVVNAPRNAGNNNRNAVVRDPDGTLVELVAKQS
jgi:catechol 2,3-dioxygenase-like lactoylglutathione lyase family enzyme